MPFHMCPLDPKAQRIITAPSFLPKERFPISLRAQLNRAPLDIPKPEAEKLFKRREFWLGSNRFAVKVGDDKSSKHLGWLGLIHYGGILGGAKINMWAERTTDGFPALYFLASELRDERRLFAERAFLWSPKDFLIFAHNLESRVKGAGGKLILATYNIARELGVKKIVFEVSQDNWSAMQIFFHMDWGRIISEGRDLWEVIV